MAKQRLQLDNTMRQRFAALRTLEEIQRLDPVTFEYFVAYLYEREGYSASTTITETDLQADLLLQRAGQTTLVQCRPTAVRVEQQAVLDLFEAMRRAGATFAALVTTGAISPEANAWAAGRPLALIDGPQLRTWHRRLHGARSKQRSGWPLYGALAAGVALLCIGGSLLGYLLLNGVAADWFGGLVAEATLPAPPVIGTAATEVPGTLPATESGVAATLPATEPALAPTITRPSATLLLEAPRLAQPIAVDGNLGDWEPALPTYPAPYRVYQGPGWDGTDDLEATWWLGWTEAGMYVGVDVVDDQHVQIESGRTAYLGDSAELQFDTNLEQDYGPAVSPDDFQILLSPGNFAGNPPSAFRFQGTATGGYRDAGEVEIPVAAQPTANGYSLEGFIPWAALELRPEAGLALGLSLNVTDNDTPGTAAQEVMYATTPDRAHRDPTTWARLLLLP